MFVALYPIIIVTWNATTQQTQAIMLRHCATTTATGPMLPCRQDVAMMLKQEERHREKQSTIQRYEFHFTSIQRTSSITYFAVRKTTQHKLPQLKYYTRLGLLWLYFKTFLGKFLQKRSFTNKRPSKVLNSLTRLLIFQYMEGKNSLRKAIIRFIS